MKKCSIILILIVISSILNIPYIDVSGAEIKPHENPNIIREDIDPISLLRLYIFMLGGIAGAEEINISYTLNLINQAYFPKDINYLTNRINKLLENLHVNLNMTYKYIEEARLLAEYGVYQKALNTLNRAKVTLFVANQSLIRLSETFNELLSKIRFAIHGYNIGYYRDEIQRLLDKIEVLIREIYKLQAEAERETSLEYEKAKGKIATFISINVNYSKVKVGDNFMLYGKLYSENKTPLAYRAIHIVTPFITAMIYTDENGIYNISLNVHNYYNETARIRVFYKPYGDDEGIFLSGYNYTDINIIYIKTTLDVYIPRVTMPGAQINIMGNISPWTGTIEREVTISFDGNVLSSFKIFKSTFNYTFILPINETVGPHTISIYVSPHGEYSGVNIKHIIMITYIPIYLAISILKETIFYPLDSIYIKGAIYDEFGEPLSNTNVNIHFKGQNFSIVTGLDGSFSFRAPAPAHHGELKVTIKVIPEEPWYSPQLRIIFLNVINVPLLVSSIVSIFSIAIALSFYVIPHLKRRFRPTSVLERPTRLRRREIREVRGDKLDILTRKRGAIINLYSKIVNLLSKFFGPPKPQETLREYYSRIKGLISIVADKLWRLTRYVEYELYSGRRPSIRMVRDAENIYKVIINAIKRKFKI